MKEATMVYKYPGPHEMHGGNFDYKIVDAGVEGELEKAQEEGWSLTTPDAKAKAKAEEDAAAAAKPATAKK